MLRFRRELRPALQRVQINGIDNAFLRELIYAVYVVRYQASLCPVTLNPKADQTNVSCRPTMIY